MFQPLEWVPCKARSFVRVNDKCLMVGHICDVYVCPFLVDMHDVVYYLRIFFFTISAVLLFILVFVRLFTCFLDLPLMNSMWATFLRSWVSIGLRNLCLENLRSIISCGLVCIIRSVLRHGGVFGALWAWAAFSGVLRDSGTGLQFHNFLGIWGRDFSCIKRFLCSKN